MGTAKTVFLVLSVLLNFGFIGFFLVLHFTPWFDIPLAAYSHQKNCERDFDSVIKMADKLPTGQREQAKQLFGSVLCQKDYRTGEPVNDQTFSNLLKSLDASNNQGAGQ